MVKVSVVVPVYNVADYLRQCLDSLVGQTLREIEIICVDDGSTDCSGAILDEYAAKDPRIKVIHQPNAGAGSARNVGMDAATGEYLHFLDPDDWCRRGMLKALYRRAVRTCADIVVMGKIQVDGVSGKKLATKWVEPRFWLRRQPFAPADIADDLFTFSQTIVWDKFFRTEFVRRRGIRFQNLRNYNDLYFVDVALATAESIAVEFGAWVLHRIRRPGSLQNLKEKSPNCNFQAFDAVWSRLQELGLGKRYQLGLLRALLNSGFYNLRTLTLRENREACLEGLKRRVADLRPVEGFGRRTGTARWVNLVMAATSPDDIAQSTSSGPGRRQRLAAHFSFFVYAGWKIAVHVVRTALWRA